MRRTVLGSPPSLIASPAPWTGADSLRDAVCAAACWPVGLEGRTVDATHATDATRRQRKGGMRRLVLEVDAASSQRSDTTHGWQVTVLDASCALAVARPRGGEGHHVTCRVMGSSCYGTVCQYHARPSIQCPFRGSLDSRLNQALDKARVAWNGDPTHEQSASAERMVHARDVLKLLTARPLSPV